VPLMTFARVEWAARPRRPGQFTKKSFLEYNRSLEDGEWRLGRRGRRKLRVRLACSLKKGEPSTCGRGPFSWGREEGYFPQKVHRRRYQKGEAGQRCLTERWRKIRGRNRSGQEGTHGTKKNREDGLSGMRGRVSIPCIAGGERSMQIRRRKHNGEEECAKRGGTPHLGGPPQLGRAIQEKKSP